MFTNEIPKPSTVCSVQAHNLTMPNFATGGVVARWVYGWQLYYWMGFTQDGSSKGGAAVKFYLTQCVQIYSGESYLRFVS